MSASPELAGGCVCCSLLGEFEAAVNEIITRVAPELIVVETTGLAEPEALVFDIQETLPQCGSTASFQSWTPTCSFASPSLATPPGCKSKGADILLLNKIDLIEPEQIEPVEAKLREINPTAAIVRTERCRIDPELLFGIGRGEAVAAPGPGSPIPADAQTSARIRVVHIHVRQKIFSRLL